MTQADAAESPKINGGKWVTAGTCFAFALLLLMGCAWAYRLLVLYAYREKVILVAWMVGGTAAALCLAGSMRALGQVPQGRRLVSRLAVALLQRFLLVMQIGAMAIVLAAAAIWIFGFQIPETDSSVLTPEWQAPDPPPGPQPPVRSRFSFGETPP